MRKSLILMASCVFCTACTLSPMTYEEKSAEVLKRGYKGSTEQIQAEWKYHIDYQYFRAAWLIVNESESAGLALSEPAFYDYSGRNLTSVGIGLGSGFKFGLTSFIFDFASGLGPEMAQRIYYDSTRTKLALPNVTFAKLYPPSSEVSFDDALTEITSFYNAVYNEDGNCKANGYTEEYQYRKTIGAINEPGLYYRYAYRCKSAVDGKNTKLVAIHLLVYPSEDVGMLAMIENKCNLNPDGENGGYVDTSQCGRPEAIRLSAKMESFEDWMMLVTEPSSEDKGVMEVSVEYKGVNIVLPDPQIINEIYRDFLREK